MKRKTFSIYEKGKEKRYKWEDTFKFRDIDTKKEYNIVAKHPDIAIQKLNKKAKKTVNYEFLGFK